MDTPPGEPTDPDTLLAARAERTRHRRYDTVCDGCKRDVGSSDNLRKKIVRFTTMGGKVERSRVVAWLCIVPATDGGPSCVQLDDDFNREKYAQTHGIAKEDSA